MAETHDWRCDEIRLSFLLATLADPLAAVGNPGGACPSTACDPCPTSSLDRVTELTATDTLGLLAGVHDAVDRVSESLHAASPSAAEDVFPIPGSASVVAGSGASHIAPFDLEVLR